MTLVSRIKDDMRARISTGSPLPPKLTLKAIAQFYDVSLTPVRDAVALMVKEGILLKKNNGRLAVNPQLIGTAESEEMPPSFHSGPSWVEKIENDLYMRSLKGESGYLREEATAEQYDISRMRIRHVFNRLAGRGLIEHVPRCGWLIRGFDESDMEAYLQVRELLEVKALELSHNHLDADELRQMLAENQTDFVIRESRLNNDLHRYLVNCSGNRFIQEFFEQSASSYYLKLFELVGLQMEVMEEMAGQHRAILTALIEKDWERAQHELVNHIRAQKGVMVELFGRLRQNNASDHSDVPKHDSSEALDGTMRN